MFPRVIIVIITSKIFNQSIFLHVSVMQSCKSVGCLYWFLRGKPNYPPGSAESLRPAGWDIPSSHTAVRGTFKQVFSVGKYWFYSSLNRASLIWIDIMICSCSSGLASAHQRAQFPAGPGGCRQACGHPAGRVGWTVRGTRSRPVLDFYPSSWKCLPRSFSHHQLPLHSNSNGQYCWNHASIGGLELKCCFSLSQSSQSGHFTVLSLPPLSLSDITAALESKLHTDQRRLVQDQWKLLVQACESCPCPLYLEAAYVESLHWTSYLASSSLNVPGSLQELYINLLSRLERDLGRQLVRRAAMLICLSRHGVTEEVSLCSNKTLT